LDLLLDAVYSLRERMPELRLASLPHGATRPDYLARCERRALALGHHGLIQWSVTAENLPLWYATATVVCLPSRSAADARPRVLAAAAARPVVASRVEPVASEIVDGETGFLVAPGDVAMMTAAIEVLLRDEEEAARLGTAARVRAEEEFSAASVATGLHGLWVESVERSARTASNGRH
jgi:glycosyltransferase involved in cell wall biosynthesis